MAAEVVWMGECKREQYSFDGSYKKFLELMFGWSNQRAL